jgi:serine/threonine protein kinase
MVSSPLSRADKVLFTTMEKKWKITDYGYVRKNIGLSLMAMRKPAKNGVYDPPEVLLEGCDKDAKTDVWSLGCILYEITCRRIMFETTKNMVDHIESTRPVEVISTHESRYIELMRQLIMHAIKADPEQRSSSSCILTTIEDVLTHL